MMIRWVHIRVFDTSFEVVVYWDPDIPARHFSHTFITWTGVMNYLQRLDALPELVDFRVMSVRLWNTASNKETNNGR